MRYENFLIPVGASDELVVDFAATSAALAADPSWIPKIFGLWMSAETPPFSWTLFFAAAANEPVPANVVIMDSMEAIPETIVAPVAIDVVNRAIVCPAGYPVPRGAEAPMGLRVSTSGLATVGRIRIQWDWKRDA